MSDGAATIHTYMTEQQYGKHRFMASKTKTWTDDIYDMHDKFGVHKWIDQKVKENDKESLRKFLEFRIAFLQEELDETKAALEAGDSKEILDGLIDLCVIAIGTMDAFGADAEEAWNEVHGANMAKEPGVKPSRPNPLGLPDLIKPDGWTGPEHEGLVGFLSVVTEEDEELPRW